jgi:hypothetical protein
MRQLLVFAVLPILAVPSCSPLQVSAQAGYAQVALDGELGYATGSTTPAVRQDVEGAFGLGDDQGVPYGRLIADFGVPVIGVSGIFFEDDGTGQLTQDFGGIPAGVPVRSDLELWNALTSLAFEIEIGPVSVSPGLAADYIDLKLQVADAFGAQVETVELSGPVPMVFLRAEVEVWKLAGVVEGGYTQFEIDDADASVLDLTGLIELRLDRLNIFVGYRTFAFEGDGVIDDDSFDADITLDGFLIGGGVQF